MATKPSSGSSTGLGGGTSTPTTPIAAASAASKKGPATLLYYGTLESIATTGSGSNGNIEEIRFRSPVVITQVRLLPLPQQQQQPA
jgi:hypothetical protein